MGIGPRQREAIAELGKEVRFFAAMLALWTFAHALLGGLSGTAWTLTIFFGVIYGYPMTAVVGFLDYFSHRLAKGLVARLLFLLLAAGAFYAFLNYATTMKISDHPEMWYFNYRQNRRDLGPGTLLVVLGYLIHGFRRDHVAKRSQVA